MKIKFSESGTSYNGEWFKVLVGNVVTATLSHTGVFYIVEASELVRVGMSEGDADTQDESTTWFFEVTCAMEVGDCHET